MTKRDHPKRDTRIRCTCTIFWEKTTHTKPKKKPKVFPRHGREQQQSSVAEIDTRLPIVEHHFLFLFSLLLHFVWCGWIYIAIICFGYTIISKWGTSHLHHNLLIPGLAIFSTHIFIISFVLIFSIPSRAYPITVVFFFSSFALFYISLKQDNN